MTAGDVRTMAAPRPRPHILAGLILTTWLTAACSGSAEAPTTTILEPATTTTLSTTTAPGLPTFEVAVVSFRFEPAQVKVPVGASVTFAFQQGTHTSTAEDGSWDSGDMAAGGTFDVVFDGPGEFRYFCSIHPQQMQAVITVEG